MIDLDKKQIVKKSFRDPSHIKASIVVISLLLEMLGVALMEISHLIK